MPWLYFVTGKLSRAKTNSAIMRLSGLRYDFRFDRRLT